VSLGHAVPGNSTDDLLGFVLYHQEAAYVQNAWRELPETGVGRRHILGILRLALIPASPGLATAQHDKPEIFRQIETLPDYNIRKRPHSDSILSGVSKLSLELVKLEVWKLQTIEAMETRS
jgi:hypothetical protein